MFDRLKAMLPVSRVAAKKQARKYAAAQINRLHMGWIMSPSMIDSDIRGGLTAVRARSREEAQNNGYYKGYLRDLRENVVGSQGFQLISKPMDNDTDVDVEAKNSIERHWKTWGTKEMRPEMSGMSFKNFCKLMMTASAQDGECFIWERKGTDVNPYRYAVRIMEPASIDMSLEKTLPGGNVIRFGIEFDQSRYPVAYHVIAGDKDADFFVHGDTGRKYLRVPSEEIIHLFLHDGVWQSRGMPWIHPALLDFNTLAKYKEAELIAARAGASKMGFISDGDDGQGYVGDDDEEDADDDYLYEEIEPGVIGRLKKGQQFFGFDPNHPNTAFSDFMKINLRGVAAALGESYNQFAQDLEGVSFGSLRQGALSERAVWMGLQTWAIEEALDRIFFNWLETSLFAGAITNRNGRPLPRDRFEKFREHEWQPRRWDWIDPLKDANADSLQQRDKTMSRSERIRKRGRQPIEVFTEIQQEDLLMAEMGITGARVDASIDGEKAADRLTALEIAVAEIADGG